MGTAKKKSEVRSARSRWPIRFLAMAYFASGVGIVPHSVFWVDFISRGLHQGLTAGGHYWILLGLSAAAGPLIAGWSADGSALSEVCTWHLYRK